MPGVFFGLDCAIGLVQLLPPLPEILFLRQFSLITEDVEYGRVGRGLIEEARIELEQRAEGGIVECQLAIDIEYGDTGRELIEHTTMRFGHTNKLAAQGFRLGAVDGYTRAARPTRGIDHVKHAAQACRDRWNAPNVCRTGGARERDFCSCALIKELQLAGDGIGGIFSFDRAGIGRIDEDQPSGRIASPDRRRQRIEKRSHNFDVAQQLVVTRGKIQQLLLDSADVSQTEDGAAGDDASFGFDGATGWLNSPPLAA